MQAVLCAILRATVALAGEQDLEDTPRGVKKSRKQCWVGFWGGSCGSITGCASGSLGPAPRGRISDSKGWATPHRVLTREGPRNWSEAFKLFTHIKSIKFLRVGKIFVGGCLEKALLDPTLPLRGSLQGRLRHLGTLNPCWLYFGDYGGPVTVTHWETY
jgi:hypothetical protein